MGARDLIAGAYGVTSNAPDTNFFKVISKVGKVDNSDSKGARVIISDMTTHSPKMTDENGQLNMDSDITQASKAVVSNLTTLIKSLKDLKENDQNAYDNSMIIVWGGHSDKGLPNSTTQEKILNSHSNLLIKFPHENHSKIDIVTNRLIYAPQINSIINDYFNNKSADPFTIFSKARFDLNKKMYSMVDGAYVPTIYSIEKGYFVEDNQRQIITYKESEVDLITQNLLNDMLGGRDE